MAQNARAGHSSPIITHAYIDSTNNDAMRMIDADKALHGTTIVADYQTAGRGQRGNQWNGIAGESLLMSLITVPSFPIEQQFCFSALVAVAVANAIQSINAAPDVQIKWPNDIIVNDKKAGGILIENVLRGQTWVNAVIGTGINLNQRGFDADLPNATSLRIATGNHFDRDETVRLIRTSILDTLDAPVDTQDIMRRYNAVLFKAGELQAFLKDGKEWTAKVIEAIPDGRLVVQLGDGRVEHYTHGTVTWKY